MYISKLVFSIGGFVDRISPEFYFRCNNNERIGTENERYGD
jgi:hypothetical protein